MKFTEQSKLEYGFALAFERNILPKLNALETDRLERLAALRKYMAMILAGTVALIAVILAFLGVGGNGPFFAIFIGMLGIFGAVSERSSQAHSWGSSIADAVMPDICSQVGDMIYAKSGDRFPLDGLRELRLVGGYTNAALSDLIEGVYRDTIFTVTQAHLTSKSKNSKGRSSNTTVFKGLLFHIEVPMTITAPIMITQDRGSFGNKISEVFSFGGKGRAMPKVNFDHDAFEAAFEVYSDNPENAHRIMPPAFLDALVSIGQTEGGRRGTKAMVAGFQGDSFYLALSRDEGFMELGSLTKSVMDMEDDLHGIFSDIEIVRRIIDRLHGVPV